MSFDAQPVADQGLEGPGIPPVGIDQQGPSPDANVPLEADAPNQLSAFNSPSDSPQIDLTGPGADASPEALKSYLSSDLVDYSIDTYHLHGGLEAPVAAPGGSLLSDAPLVVTTAVLAGTAADFLEAVHDYAKYLPRDAQGRFIELPESERLAREVFVRLESLLKVEGFGKAAKTLEKLIKLPAADILHLASAAREAYNEELEDPHEKGREDARFRAILAAIEKPAGETLGMAGGIELGVAALPLLELAGPVVALVAIGALGMALSKLGGVLLKEFTLNVENAMGPGDLNGLSWSAFAGFLHDTFSPVR